MQTLKVTQEGFVKTVVVNRPEQLNALNNQCLIELKQTFEKIKEQNDVRVIIITGEGPKSFVAGADIKELTELNPNSAEAASSMGQSVFKAIENCGKPVMAAVNGFALGGGCELAMAASFRLASDNAKFGLPEVTLGLIPGYGGTQRLARYVGAGRAAQLMATGDMIDANTAMDWGLVNEVLPQEKLLERANELALSIAKKAPLAVGWALQALNTGQVEGEKKGFEAEAKLFGQCFTTQDTLEGTQAFIEKRKADFQGK